MDTRWGRDDDKGATDVSSSTFGPETVVSKFLKGKRTERGDEEGDE